MRAIWVTLPGLRRYAVSDLGQVRNGRGLLIFRINDEGYPKIKLVGDNGRRHEYFVHVLVARAFLPAALPGQRYVLHRDDVRTHCCAANLRWGTHADNHADKVAAGTASAGARARRLTMRDIRAIKQFRGGAARAARRFGISNSYAREIRNGRKTRASVKFAAAAANQNSHT